MYFFWTNKNYFEEFKLNNQRDQLFMYKDDHGYKAVFDGTLLHR